MQTADFGAELAELNRRRLRVLAPLMGVLHVAHVMLFYVPAAERAFIEENLVQSTHAYIGMLNEIRDV